MNNNIQKQVQTNNHHNNNNNNLIQSTSQTIINKQITIIYQQSYLNQLIHILQHICNKLNYCLPEQQQIYVTNSLQSIKNGVIQIVDKIISQINSYQKILQNLQENLRKHIKTQIELKLYYQHLEDVITNLKKQKNDDLQIIKNLKTEISGLRQKQKYYMTMSNNNTKNNQDIGQTQSKLDTITKIKNRLSLNATGEFYNNYLTKKIDREKDTLQLRDKRESLANALKQLYQSPVQSKSQKYKKNQINNKVKSKEKSKSKEKQHSKSIKELRKTSSGKSLTMNPSINHNLHMQRNSVKNSERQKHRQQKNQKDFYKMTQNRTSNRRNSKP